jgi:hypothetical protein
MCDHEERVRERELFEIEWEEKKRKEEEEMGFREMMAKFKFQPHGPSVGFGSGTKRNLTGEPSKMMIKRLTTQRYNVYSQGLVPPKRTQIS